MTEKRKLKGRLTIEKDGQLVIDLIGDEYESINFEEGMELLIEGEFKGWDD